MQRDNMEGEEVRALLQPQANKRLTSSFLLVRLIIYRLLRYSSCSIVLEKILKFLLKVNKNMQLPRRILIIP